MHTRELLERLARISTELNMLYAEISTELPELRIVVDNTRINSEVKKIPERRLLPFPGSRPKLSISKRTKICANLNTVAVLSPAANEL